MKKVFLLMIPIVLIGMSTSSCKKDIYGCTDSNALNYSTQATEDDGSCITQTNTPQQVFEEQFSLDFGPATSYAIHYPSFNYEPGDLMILENLSDPANNYYTALPVVTGNVVVWGEYGYSAGDIWVYTDNVAGGDYFFGSNVTFGFRAILVKEKSVIANPGIEKLSVDEIKTLLD